MAFRAINHELHWSLLPWFGFAILISRTIVKLCKKEKKSYPWHRECLLKISVYSVDEDIWTFMR